MSEQKRRFFDRATPGSRSAAPRTLLHSPPTPTFIGEQSVFVGDIRGTGQFVVSGEVHGDGDLAGGLNLSNTGSWYGHVRAHHAIIAGKIVGGLIVEDKLEIGFSAEIRGHVRARTIAIAKGAIVEGEIEVTSGAPVVQFEEKRTEVKDT